MSIDEAQIRQLYQDYGAALVLFARQWCAHPEDALQEALMELTKQAICPLNPVGWLFHAVKRRALNQTRSAVRRNKYEQQVAQERTAWFEADPATRLEANELQMALAELELSDREIVIARIWGDLTFDQIGELMGISSSSVHRRYQKILTALQARLSGQVIKRDVQHGD